MELYQACSTAAVLSVLLTSCLAAIKYHVVRCCKTVCEKNVSKLFWSIRGSGEVLGKLRSGGFLASGLSA